MIPARAEDAIKGDSDQVCIVCYEFPPWQGYCTGLKAEKAIAGRFLFMVFLQPYCHITCDTIGNHRLVVYALMVEIGLPVNNR